MDILTTKFELDVSPFLKAIKTAVDAASKLLDLKPKVDATALEDLTNQIQGIDTSIDVGVNVDSASLDQISETVSNLDTTAFVKVEADTTSLDTIAQTVSNLDTTAIVNVEANTDALESIPEIISGLDTAVNVGVDVNGGQLDAVGETISGLDTTVSVGVDVNTDELDTISETVSNLDTTAFVNVQADTGSLNDAQKKVDNLTKDSKAKLKIDTDDSEVKQSQEEVNDLKEKIEDLPDKKLKVDVDSSGANKAISDIGGGLGKVGSFVSGALGGALVAAFSSARDSASGFRDSFNEAGETAGNIADNLERTVSQATGLNIESDAFAGELNRANSFAGELSDQFAFSVDRTRDLYSSVVGLSGQTGKAAEDTTKLALGIEAASAGAISAEQAAKLLAKGIADPESAAQLEVLTKKFPQLKDALSSTAPLAEKAQQGIDALGSTFQTLEQQSGGVGESLDKIGGRFNLAFQGISKTFEDSLEPIFQALVPAVSGLISTLAPVIEQLAGDLGGRLAELATTVIPLLVDALGPLVNTIGEILPPIVDLLVGAFESLLPVIAQIIQQLGPLLAQLVGALAPVLGDIIGVISQLAGRIIQALLPVITKILATIVKLLPVLSPIIDALGDTLGPIIDTLGTLLIALIDPLLPLIEILVKSLAPILEVVVRVLGILINAGLKVLTPLLKGLISPLTLIGNLFNAVAGFAQKVSGWFTKLINDNPILKRVFDAVKTAIQNLLGLLPDFIKEALGMQTANVALAKSSKQAADDGAKQGKTTEDNTNKTKDNTDKTKDNTKAKGANAKEIDKQVVALENIKKAYDEEKKAIDDKKNAALIALDEQRLAEGRLTESIDDKLKKQQIERKATEELSAAQQGLGKSLQTFADANKKLSTDATKSFQELSNTVVQAGNDVRKQFTAQGFAELQFRVDLDQKGLADTLAGIDKTISATAKNFGKVFKDESELIAGVINGTTNTFVKAGEEQIGSLEKALNALTGQERRLQAIVDIDVSEAGIEATRKRFADISTELSQTRVLIETETDPEKLAELRTQLKALEDEQVVLAIALDPEKRKATEDQLESVKGKIEETTQSVEDLDDKLNETLGKTRLAAIPLQIDVELPDLNAKQREIELTFRTSIETANQAYEKEFADLEDLYDRGLLNDQQFFNATSALQRRRTDVVEKAGKERTNALKEEARESNLAVKLFDSIARNIEAVLFPDANVISESQDGTKNALDEQYKLLRTQLELQLLTYEDYNKAVLELEGKRNEEQNKLQEESRKRQLDGLKAITADVLPQLNEAFAKSNEELAKTLANSSASFEEIGNKSLEVLAATSAQALALAVQNAASLDEIGKQFAKQLVSGLLNVLQAQLQAAIIGAIFSEAQQKGALGLAVGAAVGAALTALFAAAKAKINAALGFEKGGYTGNKGTKEVAGVVHGQEYVVNAKATKKNRKALEYINSSNGSFEQFVNMQFGDRIVNIEKAIDGLQFKYNHEGIIKGIVERSVKQNVFNNESVRNYNQTKVANYVDTSTMSTSINGLAMTMDSRMASMERTIDTAIRQNATLTRSAQQLDVKVASDPGSSITWLRKQGKINSNR